jgi:twitching motility protein PilT
MICTPAVRALIRDDKVHQIYSIMQAGKKHGMQTMNDALYQLIIQGEVRLEDALKRSGDPTELQRMVGGNGAA